ncbi:hypothetical protein QRD02_00025 [Aequorivita sp. SDUM287046]|uniref:Uncharacterized protein n=1 Tax=Aequorivita aurantiaca TaxID=3053356 RepID=A0ABT8DFR1_9FLAO|nr:hypothetical protein [Aequorivita aurantiaca]MDN3722751.1 hypothetical protein [Aequorivita aurantiaca]
MKLQEAKELYDKLKPFENNSEMEGGFIIHKFFILPLKYIKQNKITIDWHILMESDDILENKLLDNKNLDFDIVAIHQARLSVFLTSKDIKLFKSFLI